MEADLTIGSFSNWERLEKDICVHFASVPMKNIRKSADDSMTKIKDILPYSSRGIGGTNLTNQEQRRLATTPYQPIFDRYCIGKRAGSHHLHDIPLID